MTRHHLNVYAECAVVYFIGDSSIWFSLIYEQCYLTVQILFECDTSSAAWFFAVCIISSSAWFIFRSVWREFGWLLFCNLCIMLLFFFPISPIGVKAVLLSSFSSVIPILKFGESHNWNFSDRKSSIEKQFNQLLRLSNHKIWHLSLNLFLVILP